MAISKIAKKEEVAQVEDSKMNLVRRNRKKAFDICKIIFRIAFSNLGMLVLNMAYAVLGRPHRYSSARWTIWVQLLNAEHHSECSVT